MASNAIGHYRQGYRHGLRSCAQEAYLCQRMRPVKPCSAVFPLNRPDHDYLKARIAGVSQRNRKYNLGD